jgi:hypothetical protein
LDGCLRACWGRQRRTASTCLAQLWRPSSKRRPCTLQSWSSLEPAMRGLVGRSPMSAATGVHRPALVRSDRSTGGAVCRLRCPLSVSHCSRAAGRGERGWEADAARHHRTRAEPLTRGDLPPATSVEQVSLTGQPPPQRERPARKLVGRLPRETSWRASKKRGASTLALTGCRSVVQMRCAQSWLIPCAGRLADRPLESAQSECRARSHSKAPTHCA